MKSNRTLLAKTSDSSFNTEIYRSNGVIQSIIDIDAYVLSMQAVAQERYPNCQVKYKLVVRSDDNLMTYIDEIRSEIYSLENLRYTDDQISFLYKRMPWLKPMFLEYLRSFQLNPRKNVQFEFTNNQLEISIVGLWANVMPLEIMILSILAEVRNRNEFPDLQMITFRKNMHEAISEVKKHIDDKRVQGFKFMEFGTRRRTSYNVQKQALEMLKKELPENFVGTSNLHFAKEMNLPVHGTMAHQYMSAHQVLSPLATHQRDAMRVWDEVFQGRLGVFLPDTIKTDAFLKDFDYHMANSSKGLRQDSGDPRVFANKVISHYKSLDINPLTKRIVFSDNLNFKKSVELTSEFEGQIDVYTAMGTYLTNMFDGEIGVNGKEFKALSAVIKLVRVNDFPVAKISDDEGKEICECPVFLAHLKKQFIKN